MPKPVSVRIWSNPMLPCTPAESMMPRSSQAPPQKLAHIDTSMRGQSESLGFSYKMRMRTFRLWIIVIAKSVQKHQQMQSGPHGHCFETDCQQPRLPEYTFILFYPSQTHRKSMSSAVSLSEIQLATNTLGSNA